MDRVLLTGSGGFVGSRFLDYYKSKYEILAPSHSRLDITDSAALSSLICGFNPRYVVHMAAIADTLYCEQNPEISAKINVDGAVNVAKGCRLCGAKMIFMSSEQIYNGNTDMIKFSESTAVSPQSVYGKQKLEAETEISKILPGSVSLRATWMYDAPIREHKINSNIFMNLISAAITEKKLSVPIHEYRGITYVWEVIEQFSKVFDLPSGVYNFGSENEISTYDTAMIFLEKLGLQSRTQNLITPNEERYCDRPRNLMISNIKLANFGINFKTTSEGFDKFIKDYNLNFKG